MSDWEAIEELLEAVRDNDERVKVVLDSVEPAMEGLLWVLTEQVRYLATAVDDLRLAVERLAKKLKEVEKR